MRALPALLNVKNISKLSYPLEGSWGSLASAKRNHGGKIDYEGGSVVTKANADPIVAFSKPPPLPPLLGPMVILSLLETYWNRDGNDG